ncbi:hypothetical protein R1sor_023876 [Riccia sorocarpa]|uniref:Uncharacterized protein n=1 Tax=Riccia sorocarpa TaxID=122646 RepID=A0ABD3GS55_9MARC
MEDNTMAIIQIARYQSFTMGRGGGNDPSMFELDLRAADRLGTTEAFEKAFENALRRTEPLVGRMHTVNGDIRTVTHKRKGPVTSRPEAPDDVVIDSQTPVPANQAHEIYTGPADSSSESDVQITHVRTRTRHSSREDDDVLITGQTFRTRPPTRGTPTPIRTNGVDPPIVATRGIPAPIRIDHPIVATRGIPPPIRIDPPIVTQHGQPVIERDYDKRFWHLSRINSSGNPACNATLSGPNAPRDLCKTKIKSSGVKVRGVATVAPSFCGYRCFQGVDRPHQFWFCPNMQYVRSKGSLACKFQMPRVTETIPVLTGTNLTQAEVEFLTSKGFVLVQRVPETFTRRDYAPNAVEMRIYVNS